MKLYGTVGSFELLSKPLKDLEDLKNVKFRADGIPVETTLPVYERPTRDEVLRNLTRATPKEIDAIVNDDKNVRANLCHAISWLIQCVYELNEKVEKLEANISIPR